LCRNKVASGFIGLFHFLKKNRFVIITVLIYLFFSVYYVGFSQTISDCGNTLNGLGDNTAGPVWKAASTDNLPPVGGYSKITNYPNGESLSSPVDAVVVGQSLLLWTTSKIAGPVCGYNLNNVLGYMSTSIVMFAFVYSLTKGKRWIALLAGYAVAFTPYFQSKIGGHPSYAFQALLIGVLWALMSLLATHKKSRAVLLAVLIAVCFYFDPYFSLLCMTIVVPFCFVWLVIKLAKFKKEKSSRAIFWLDLKNIILSVVLLLVLLSPILYVSLTQSTKINMAVAGTRDDIISAGKDYSNLPSEYLLPFSDSPIWKAMGKYGQKIHNSLYIFSTGNVTEDTVGLSLIMLLIVILFGIIAIWEKLQHRKLGLSYQLSYGADFVVYGALAVALAAVILALPPMCIFGIPLPSYILLKLTTIWRVISREYVVVNISLVVLFAIALNYFSSTIKIKRLTKSVIYVVLFLLIFFQYQTFGPFQGFEEARFSYKDSPTGYLWLKKQTNIKAVAEYPIEKAAESGAHGFYLSMQLLYNKPLLNSAVSDSSDDPVRSSIKNLSDPQTIPVLHSLGINAVIVHGVSLSEISKIPYLKVIYYGNNDKITPDSPVITNKDFIIAIISSDTPTVGSSLQFTKDLPRNNSVQTSATNWQYEVPTGTEITINKVLKNDSSKAMTSKVCFSAKASGDEELNITDEKTGVHNTVNINNKYQVIEFQAISGDILRLTTNNNNDIQMTNIGC
jgi:hypothetical protein